MAPTFGVPKSSRRDVLRVCSHLFYGFLALVALAAFYRCYQSTVLANRTVRRPGEHAVTNSPGANLDCFSWPAKQASIRDDTSKSGQVNPGLRYQGGKPCHEIQWLEDDVDSAISILCLQLVADVAVCRIGRAAGPRCSCAVLALAHRRRCSGGDRSRYSRCE